ncbi:MAG: tetratricopeptide repeat protein [Phycisphaeraceae bacterium]|nr:tetratricopeptide repeat protein [Phycisphaeraceae bacterium]
MADSVARRLGLAVTIGLVCLVTGCGPTKKDIVNNADARWKRMRSTLMLQMADQQFSAGDLDEAEKTLSQATLVDGKNPKLYTLSGRVAVERGQLERAFHLFKQSIELDPKLPEPHYYLGIVMQRWQQFDDAGKEYQAAYDLEPDNVAYLLAVGEMMVAADRPQDAMNLFENKLVYFDQNAALRAAIGKLHMMAGQAPQAVDYFRKASVLDPENSQYIEDLAAAQLAARQFEDSITTLRRLTTRLDFKDRRDIHLMLGRAYLQAERFDDAKSIFMRQTRQDATDVEAWIGLGETSWASGDITATQYAAERLIRIAPNRHEGYLLAGMVSQKRQQWPAALSFFDKAVKVAPDQVMAILLRGLSYQQVGKKTQAVADFQHVLELDPHNTQARQLLSQAGMPSSQP